MQSGGPSPNKVINPIEYLIKPINFLARNDKWLLGSFYFCTIWSGGFRHQTKIFLVFLHCKWLDQNWQVSLCYGWSTFFEGYGILWDLWNFMWGYEWSGRNLHLIFSRQQLSRILRGRMAPIQVGHRHQDRQRHRHRHLCHRHCHLRHCFNHIHQWHCHLHHCHCHTTSHSS